MEESKASPALGVFQNKLWVAFTGNTTNDLYACSSADGINWSNHAALNQSSADSPALTEFNGKLWVAFTGATSHEVLVCSYDGSVWSPNSSTGQTSAAAPAMAVFNGKLWVAFIALNGSDDILICESSDGKAWQPSAAVQGQSSKAAVSLAVSGGKLWIAFIGNTTNDTHTFCSPDGKSWSEVPLTQASTASPSLAGFNNTLWIAFKGASDDDLRLCSLGGGAWSGNHALPGQTSQAGPALTQYNGQLFAGFLSADTSDRIFVCSSPDGQNWSQAYVVANYPTQRTISIPDTGYGSGPTSANFTAELVMNSDGSYTFSGKFNNTGSIPIFTAPAQNYSVAIVVRAGNDALVFQHSGTAQNAGSDSWNIAGRNPAVASNWPDAVDGPAKCDSNNSTSGGVLGIVTSIISQLWSAAEQIAPTVIAVAGSVAG